MLILSRKDGESIYIGDDIEVYIFKHNGQVRVGIDAPPKYKILRSELSKEDYLSENMEESN